jgi:hypothetical protein
MSRELRTDEERRAIVREWDKSGLTAGEFAEPLGIQANTLRIWGRAVRGPLKHWARSRTRPVPRKVELVEVEGGLSGGVEPRIEIALINGRRLTVFTSWTPKLIAEIASALEGDE